MAALIEFFGRVKKVEKPLGFSLHFKVDPEGKHKVSATLPGDMKTEAIEVAPEQADVLLNLAYQCSNRPDPQWQAAQEALRKAWKSLSRSVEDGS